MSCILIRNTLIMWIIFFCLTQLSGCSFSHQYSTKDGAPSKDFDASKIPDAIPKNEPRSANGNSSYVEHGRKYYVLKSAKNYDKIGMASWYGTRFHGHRTSSNERYNVYGMTAASTVLPIPTYVQVTNLENGKQVVVKINDRGPFCGNRLIDVSYAAAKKLGFAGKGTTKVEVKAINPNDWHPEQIKQKTYNYPILANNNDILNTKTKNRNSTPDKKLAKNKEKQLADKKLYVQVGTFSQFNSAQKFSSRINKLITTPTKITHKTLNQKPIYEIHIGPLANATQSQLIKQLLETNGLGTATIING